MSYYLYSYYITYTKNDKLPDFIDWRNSVFCRNRNLIQKFWDCARKPPWKSCGRHVVIGRRLVHCSNSVAVSSVLIYNHFFLRLFGNRGSIELAIRIIHTVQTLYLTYTFTVSCLLFTATSAPLLPSRRWCSQQDPGKGPFEGILPECRNEIARIKNRVEMWVKVIRWHVLLRVRIEKSGVNCHSILQEYSKCHHLKILY